MRISNNEESKEPRAKNYGVRALSEKYDALVMEEKAIQCDCSPEEWCPGGIKRSEVVQHFRFNPGYAMSQIWLAHMMTLPDARKAYKDAILHLQREIKFINEQIGAGVPSEF